MKYLKNIYVWIVLILVVLILSVSEYGNVVTVNAMFPMTGGLSSYGDSASKGAILAMEDINREGGVNGMKLVLNIQDHKCDAKEAVSIYKQNVYKSKYFISAACSGTVLAIAPELEKDNVLLLGTTISTPKVTGVSKNLYRNWSSDANEAKLFAKLINEKGYQSLGIIYEETDYAKGLKVSLENYVGKNVIVSSEGFNTGTTDVRSQIVKLKDKNVDVLFISPQTVTSADVILNQMNELKFKPKMILMNDNVTKASDLLNKYNSILSGAYSADYKLQNADVITFQKKFVERFGTECKQVNICMGEYDAVRMLATAMNKTTNTGEVRDNLSKMEYRGITGTVSFDSNNDRNNAEYTLLKSDGGKLVEVK